MKLQSLSSGKSALGWQRSGVQLLSHVHCAGCQRISMMHNVWDKAHE